MGPRTAELLNLLLWSAEALVNPTWRHVFETYEGWKYRNGLLIQLGRLEQRKWITRSSKDRRDRVYRLSAQARTQILGGRDPQARWDRNWDQHWRLVIFDIPNERNAERERLRRYLHRKDFGCLQKSVWISPDPVEEERRVLAGGRVNVESLVIWEGRAIAGESAEQIVLGAWDFVSINERYSRYLRILEARPSQMGKDKAAALKFLQWLSRERKSWLDAVTRDPLLPKRLLPSNYLGQKAWQARLKIIKEVTANELS